MRKLVHSVIAGAAAIAMLFATSHAHAGLEACSDIRVGAEARCKVEVAGGCVAQCEPPRVELACAAELYAQCSGQCAAEISAQCDASCRASCDAQCRVNPPAFDCAASCNASCQADCEGRCASAANRSECAASCWATCSGQCDARCSGTPPSADCDAKCDASCKGSCGAKANMDCQLQCQSRGYAECKSRLTGGCKAQCAKPDRVLLFDILRREIGRAQRSAGYRFAVLFLDLDGFKAVNDTLGHEAGDRVLVTVSERLRACLRPMDAVARLGGDEFAVVVADVKDEAEANGVALRIRAALSTPQKLADGEHVIGASIGVVLSDARCTDPSAVLREADLAMYEEKSLQHAVRQGRALS